MHVNSANDVTQKTRGDSGRGPVSQRQSRVAARRHGSSGGGNVKDSYYSDPHQQRFRIAKQCPHSYFK